jgi:hypothetical protein
MLTTIFLLAMVIHIPISANASIMQLDQSGTESALAFTYTRNATGIYLDEPYPITILNATNRSVSIAPFGRKHVVIVHNHPDDRAWYPSEGDKEYLAFTKREVDCIVCGGRIKCYNQTGALYKKAIV